MIVTFLALLEMIRLKLIRVFQSGAFGAIRVYKRARPADAPHPIGDPAGNVQHGPTTYRADHDSRRPLATARRASGRHRTPAGRRAAPSTGASVAAEVKAIVEALIFASPEPITPKMLFKLLAERAEGRRRGGDRGAQGRLREPARAAVRRGRRRLSDRHAAGAARVGAPAVPRAVDAEADRAGARDAGGDRLQAADHRARDRRDPRRQHVRRAVDAARAAPDQDRRPQERRRPAVPLLRRRRSS